MQISESWDWEKGERVVVESMALMDGHQWQEEIHVSPDGETAAAIVCVDDGVFGLRMNDTVHDNTFDKAWKPGFTPDGRFCAFVQQDEEWTLAENGEPWDERYGFIWNPCFSTDGATIATAVQQDMQYGMSVNGTAWETLFESASGFTLSTNGKRTAAVVQTRSLGQADLLTFREGIFTVAVDGVPWENTFMNVWDPVFSPYAHRVAAQVRLTLYDYTIAVDGTPWPMHFQCVWDPCFHPNSSMVAAPVRQAGKWGIAEDGNMLWKPRYFNCWHLQYSPDGSRLFAIVAPEYGKFTVAVDEKTWSVTAPVVTDLVLSPDGTRAAALGNNDNKAWHIMVDGKIWHGRYDMAWKPVFSADGRQVATRVRAGDRYAIVVNDRTMGGEFDKAWDPVFSPDGTKVLIRAMRNHTLLRIVADVPR